MCRYHGGVLAIMCTLATSHKPYIAALLTLGVHAQRGLRYLVCVCVCVCMLYTCKTEDV